MGRNTPIRILIADDDPIVRGLLRGLLRRESHMELIGEAVDGNEAINLIQQLSPDILLLDLLMPHLPGIDTLRKLALAEAPVRTIVLAAHAEKRQIVESLQLGARGILLKKSIACLTPCIEAVSEGYYWVQDRKISMIAEIIHDLLRTSKPEQNVAQKFRLTQREMHILSLVTLGNTNREIGGTLSISEETVKRHLVNIFNKVGMSTRLELAMFAIDHRLVSL